VRPIAIVVLPPDLDDPHVDIVILSAGLDANG
jgi:hypothetical protein